MIEVLNLVWYSSYGGVGDVLAQWEQAGFFSYFLPFLLIFALVFGILGKTKIFKDNKSVNGIIALVVGLMSLQMDFVSGFFSEVFPRLGVGLAVILIVVILLGIFLPKEKWVDYTLFGIAAIVLIAVLVQSSSAAGWSSGNWWQENWPVAAGVIFIFILLAIIVGGSGEDKPGDTKKYSKFLDSMFKD